MASTTKTFVNGTTPFCEDVDLNGFKNENNNLIESTGQTLNNGDFEQTNKAVALYSIVGQFMEATGSADIYTINAPAPRVNPPARVDGAILRFTAPATNTGACTLDAFGTGADDIKLRGGSVDPEAGDIVSGQPVTVIDRGSYFELDRSGTVRLVVISTSDAAWVPSPDVKALKITAVGGGSGGGGVDGQGAGTAAAAVGGSAAAAGIIHTKIIDPSYNIQIGTGGAGGSAGNNAGQDGTSTTITSANITAEAQGGQGGDGATGTSASALISGELGGLATGFDWNIRGSDSNLALVVNGEVASSGPGAAAYNGAEKRNNAANNPGLDSDTNGGGGSAAISINATTNHPGGDGADGIVVIEEFF